MSKAGLEALTKSTALEYAPFGIRVNSVAPSLVDTNHFRYAGLTEGENRALRHRVEKNHPMKRMALGEEIARAVVFLTSDKAEKIVGHTMMVTGAKHLALMGYQDWKGGDKMDRRFEPSSSGLLGAWVGLKEKFTKRPPAGPEGSDAWI